MLVLCASLFGCSGSQPGGGMESGGGEVASGSATGTNAPRSFVLFETPTITHDKDYYSFTPFVSPNAPTNWLSPVDYTNGTADLRVEVISIKEETSKFYYTVTWLPGADKDADEFLRPAVYVDKGPGVYGGPFPVKEIEHVVGGQTPGTPVGNDWDWAHAFTSVAGDLVAYPDGGEKTYPVTVKVKLTISAP